MVRLQSHFESASCYFLSYVVLFVLTKYPRVVLGAIVDFPKIMNCRRSIVVSHMRHSQIGAGHELN